MLSLYAASPMKEYIIKEDVYQIVAESPTVSVLKWKNDMIPASKIKSMVNYCSSVGGESIMVEKTAKKNLFGDIYYEMSCKAPNNQGFVLSKKGGFYFLTHESPQEVGYAMKAYVAEEKLDEKHSPKEFYSSMLDFGTNFYDFYGYCVAKGGEYFISNTTTGNKAVKANDYIVKGVGLRGLSLKDEGKQWCINTKNPSNEFIITLSPHPYNSTMRFQVTQEGRVERKEIIFETDTNPTYLLQRSESQVEEREALSNTVMMSKSPTQPITALAAKTIASKNTVLERQNGSVLEGVYLGQNDSGCQLAAVMSAPDQSYGHTIVYNDKNPASWIMNYKQCSNAPIEYLGESFERSFPASITQEYNRVLNMCRIRGAAMGSFMGYNIDCSRQGSMAQPIHEVTITKKDKLVIRTYEK
jgi:hypothetical protein